MDLPVTSHKGLYFDDMVIGVSLFANNLEKRKENESLTILSFLKENKIKSNVDVKSNGSESI